MRQAQDLAQLLDSKVRVLGIPVGLDFIIGLIPFIGDVLTTGAALRIVYLGRKLGMPSQLLQAMLRHVAIDFVLSLLPFVGDLVDLFYKSNRANVKIMESWWLQKNKGNLANHTQQALEEWQTKLDKLD